MLKLPLTNHQGLTDTLYTALNNVRVFVQFQREFSAVIFYRPCQTQITTTC
jgi:hypothetical protein